MRIAFALLWTLAAAAAPQARADRPPPSQVTCRTQVLECRRADAGAAAAPLVVISACSDGSHRAELATGEAAKSKSGPAKVYLDVAQLRGARKGSPTHWRNAEFDLAVDLSDDGADAHAGTVQYRRLGLQASVRCW